MITDPNICYNIGKEMKIVATNKHNWQEIFDYAMHYGWYCNHGTTHALEIPGYRVQSYLAKIDAYVKTRFIVNVYIGKQYIMQEVMYKPITKGSIDFLPFPPKVYHNLFFNMKNMVDWSYPLDWKPLMEIEEISGRIMLKFKISDWRRLVWGVNLSTISKTPWGLLIETFGTALPFSCMYPDTIKTLDDAAEVWSTVTSLARLNHKRNGYFEDEIARYRSWMTDKMRAIEEYQSNLNAVCDGAANAMDVLESQYGIKIIV